MLLSDGMVVGFCCGFSQVAAQAFVVISAKEAAGNLRPEGAALLKVAAWGFAWAIPYTMALWAVDWACSGLPGPPLHGLQVNIVLFFALAWLGMAVGVFARSITKRIKTATGVDLLARAAGRSALIGGAIGMVLSGIYIFGPHLLRG